MTRPSARAVRRTANDLSDQMAPHVSHARDVMVDTVLPRARDTMVDTVLPRARDAKDVMVDTVLPRARDAKEVMVDTVMPRARDAKDVMVDTVLPKAKDTMETVLPKAKAAGVGLAIRAGLAEPPKKRHPFRKAAVLGVVAVGAYAAWNAWRLPHASEDWTQSDGTAGSARPGESPDAAEVPGVPADSTRLAF